MHRMFILFLLLVIGVATAGCGSVKNTNPAEVKILSAEEIITVFAEQGLAIQTAERQKNNIFQKELNG